MRAGLSNLLVCSVFTVLFVSALQRIPDAVDPLSMQEVAAVPTIELSKTNIVGQTFVFNYPNLHSIQVRWSFSKDSTLTPSSRITLHVRRHIDDLFDVASSSVSLTDIRDNDYSKFDFATIQDSEGRSFYFYFDASQVEMERGGISLWTSSDDAYPDGLMYVNGIPTKGDLVFRAYYEPDLLMILLSLKQMLSHELFAMVFVPLISLLPGLALLFLLDGIGKFHPVEALGMASGLGLSIVSSGSIILMCLGLAVRWLTICLAAISFISLAVYVRRFFPRSPRLYFEQWFNHHQPNLSLWALAGFSMVSISIGLIQIRDTPVPLWVDSPVHARNIKDIIDLGYLPVFNFYHFGYHSVVALLVQLSGISIPQAMLVVGQLLITQTGFSVFLLSKRLSGSDIAGLTSAICIWFLTPTPTLSIIWGRYPLLMGTALLPIALLYFIELIESQRFDFRMLFLAVITCVGVAFAHVRLTAFYLIFAVIYLGYRLWWKRGNQRVASILLRVGVACGVSLLFGVIWLVVVFSNGITWQMITARNTEMSSLFNDISFTSKIMLWHHGVEVLVLALIGTIIGLARHIKYILVVITWFIVLCGISVVLQEIIGGEYLPLSFVILMGFLPASMVVGNLMQFLYAKTAFSSSRRINLATAMWVGTALIASVLGAREMVSIVSPGSILFSKADENAMIWIDEHTPVDAKFLVNSFAWLASTYRPSDGGGWIPFSTGRSVDFIDFSSASGNVDNETVSGWIDAKGITFIYLGWQPGILRKFDFACQPNRYKSIYNQGGVQIFAVRALRSQELTVASNPNCDN